MVDGPTEVSDPDSTESNRNLVRSFLEEILLNGEFDKLPTYVDEEYFAEHNPRSGDGLSALHLALAESAPDGGMRIRYDKIHRILADGSFVLSVSEGSLNGAHTSFYDLFRLAQGELVEHWDTTESITPRSEWKNENGKF
jgi:predicted SnoaL-like aldol condensation-catalyzing enzyme